MNLLITCIMYKYVHMKFYHHHHHHHHHNRPHYRQLGTAQAVETFLLLLLFLEMFAVWAEERRLD